MLCLSSENRAYSEGTEAGYISLFSWREVFVWRSREEYLFPNDSVSVLQAAHSAEIHK